LIHVSELSAATRDDVSMFLITRRTLIGFGLCIAGVLPAPASRADRDRDHDEARRAVERAEALPLFDILARVRSQLGGEVVGVSFKRRRENWVYEFKVIGPGGKLTEVYVDAATAEILKWEKH
jgi:uncharacterized membrane protein YkoI